MTISAVDITGVQVDTQNGNHKIQNMQIDVTGTPNTTSPVSVYAIDATGKSFLVGTFNVALNDQGFNDFNTQSVDLNIPNGYYTFTATAEGGTITDTYESSFFVCFLKGTLIRTSAGEVAVEDLALGDLVLTADGRAVPVVFIGHQTVHARFNGSERATPIRIRAGALGDNVPTRDLFVSQNHALLVGDTLCLAQALVNGTTIAACPAPTEIFTYFSVELPTHEVILAEGAPAESFSDNVSRDLFDNGAEFARLYPEGRAVGEMDIPLARSARQVPAAVRTIIAERAALLLGEGTAQAA